MRAPPKNSRAGRIGIIGRGHFCAKLVRGTSVRVLPKCRPMIVYKNYIYSSFTREAAHRGTYRPMISNFYLSPDTPLKSLIRLCTRNENVLLRWPRRAIPSFHSTSTFILPSFYSATFQLPSFHSQFIAHAHNHFCDVATPLISSVPYGWCSMHGTLVPFSGCSPCTFPGCLLSGIFSSIVSRCVILVHVITQS